MNFGARTEVNKTSVLTAGALKEAIDLTILQMKKIYIGIFKDPRYYSDGFIWLLLEKLGNAPLLTFFEKYGTKPLQGICNERVLYHLTKSDAPIIEIIDNNASEYTVSSALCDTGKTAKWRKQHFWLQFDFMDNDGNSFSDQSLPYKKEIYKFLKDQFECLGIKAEIEIMCS